MLCKITHCAGCVSANTRPHVICGCLQWIFPFKTKARSSRTVTSYLWSEEVGQANKVHHLGLVSSSTILHTTELSIARRSIFCSQCCRIQVGCLQHFTSYKLGFLPKYQLSKYQLPECQLPKYQLQKCQIPKMSTPKMSTPKIYITMYR